MTESWHWFVKYKIRHTQNKYTCIETNFFFPLGRDWKENRFWAISPVSARELRDFSSWNAVKVSDICLCLKLDAAQILGGSSSASPPTFWGKACQQMSDHGWGRVGRGELTLVSRPLWWAKASFLHLLLWAELPRVCQASGTRCKWECSRNCCCSAGRAVLVVLSPFLLYFRVVPCKEYLKESKVLQSWRKALPNVASTRMVGQARAGSLLHCTVWAREMGV